MKKKLWKRRLFISFLVPVFILVISFMAIVGIMSFRAYNNQLNNDIKSIVSLIDRDKKAGVVNEEIIVKYDVIGKISLIDEKGKLISSSDNAIKNEKNLLGREEVKEALRMEQGSSLRYDDVNSEYIFYKAFLLSDDIIIIAIPLITTTEMIMALLGYTLLAGLLTIAIAAVLSYYFFNRNIKPMMILEKYIRRTYKQKNIAEVDIQSLPKELKKIADIFKMTTRSLEETAAKEQEQKLYLYSTIDTMEDGFIAIDEISNIRLINKSAKEIFELDSEDIIGSNLMVQTQNFELIDAVNESDEKPTTREIVIEDKTYKLTIYPLGQEKGKLITLNDITKLNQLENMRKEFVSNVSHELKTPLTAIRGFVETLKDGAIEDPNTAGKFLKIIDIESQRLEKLISDLLELSSIESNKISRLNVDIDIRSVANSAIEDYKVTAAKRNISLISNIEESHIIKGNLELFKAMLYNLVSNAIKYNVENGSVAISLKEVANGILINVKDTGIGISNDDIFRIFERFYKVDKSRSYDPESTGLGLSIVKHILDLFDGDISVDSTLGEGTTFKVYLPKKEE
jgi:two-component system, OmpR family, phosphate regulon sensor histidine kinase PhoR